ncbi:MAG: hypothetical protein LH471_06350 [Salinibacterium sp.]|nr:hypothetical protein [Salinibacterium sp.]
MTSRRGDLGRGDRGDLGHGDGDRGGDRRGGGDGRGELSLYGECMGFGGWARDRMVNADAVYGLILYSALIAAVSDDDANALDVLIGAGLSLIVFWGAHVFAGAITGHGAERPLGQAVGDAVAHSSGMLYASIIPSIPLIIGALGLIGTDDAVSLSLLIATLILGIVGYRAFAERKRPIIVRILGGLGAAMFGFLVILLNVIVH